MLFQLLRPLLLPQIPSWQLAPAMTPSACTSETQSPVTANLALLSSFSLLDPPDILSTGTALAKSFWLAPLLQLVSSDRHLSVTSTWAILFRRSLSPYLHSPDCTSHCVLDHVSVVQTSSQTT